MAYIVPVFIILVIIFSVIKKQNVYGLFVEGVKGAIPFVLSLFPYIVAILIMSELFEVSGLSSYFTKITAPVFKFFGVPPELIKLIIIKPFSGSGSLALLEEVFNAYGVSGYIPLCACCIYGSSETVFYISAIYYVKCKNKKATKAILISLFATFFSTILTCNILRLFY